MFQIDYKTFYTKKSLSLKKKLCDPEKKVIIFHIFSSKALINEMRPFSKIGLRGQWNKMKFPLPGIPDCFLLQELLKFQEKASMVEEIILESPNLQMAITWKEVQALSKTKG